MLVTLKANNMGKSSLRDRTVNGLGWSFVGNTLGYGITFLVGLLLARLLSPEEYGLIGIVTVFVTVFNTMTESGFSSALIRKNDADESDYNTAFYTNIAFSLILYLALFLCAPAIASFFKRPELTRLTRVMGLCLIVNALTFTQSTILSKKMAFKTKTKVSVISALVSGAVGIWMAISGYGVWALVGQQLSKQIASSICLWLFIGWMPSMRFSKVSFRYLWGFGWKMSASGMIDSVAGQISNFVIGKVYSPASLGQFSRSGQFSGLFSSGLTSVVQQVSYPALSEIQDDIERLTAAYRKIIKTTMFVTAVCMFALGAVSEPLLFCLIGPQWHDAAVYLPLMCIEMSLYPLHAINLNMLQIQGRSDLFLKLEIIKKSVCIPVILIGVFIGIIPMLIAGIFAGFFCFFLNAHWSGKMIGYSALSQLRDVAPSFGTATLVALSVYFLKFIPLSYWVILPVQIVVGIVVFIIACKVLGIREYDEIKGFVLSKLRPDEK